MISIFTTPKPFKGHFATIQENAIGSWTKLKPKCQIILIGNEFGIEEIAKKYKALHIKEVQKNEFGTPVLPDVFKKATNVARYPILAYVNCDIILMDDFLFSIKKVPLRNYFLIGKRWNLDLNKKIIFKDGWQEKLKREVAKRGQMGRKGANDYFVFKKGTNFQIPDFAIGRTSWDNWLIFRAKQLGLPVVDATKSILAIHQSHDYSHAGGYKVVWEGPESIINKQLAGDIRKLFNVKDADYDLVMGVMRKKAMSFSRIVNYLQTLPVLKPKHTFLVSPILFTFKFTAFIRDRLLR